MLTVRLTFFFINLLCGDDFTPSIVFFLGKKCVKNDVADKPWFRARRVVDMPLNLLTSDRAVDGIGQFV